MSKRTLFSCRGCGYESPRWLGRCPSCEEWNTFVEVTLPGEVKQGKREEGRNGAVRLNEEPPVIYDRLLTGRPEFDRVLGGGVVPGSLILLGGEPGVGKSTLLLQVAAGLEASYGEVLYAGAEESVFQIKLRAERLNLRESKLLLLQESEVDYIVREAEKIKAKALIIDSVQTMRASGNSGLPGSPGQVREVVQRLMEFVKATGIICFLVGHITKSGLLAGPKLIEHMVDVVLYFEGDRRYSYRILRVTKNRFGSTQEIALYDFSERGLIPVVNPSASFLSERRPDQSGTVVTPVMEGSLQLLVEIQTLVAGGSYGNPRRLVTGLDNQRVAMVLAVLERRAGLPLSGQDVYVSVIGGVRTEEPAADLAVALAIASNLYDRPLPHDLAAFGEIGLTGEVRRVGGGTKRLAELRRHGFSRVVIPRSMVEEVDSERLEIIGVSSVQEMLAYLRKGGGIERDRGTAKNPPDGCSRNGFI